MPEIEVRARAGAEGGVVKHQVLCTVHPHSCSSCCLPSRDVHFAMCTFTYLAQALSKTSAPLLHSLSQFYHKNPSLAVVRCFNCIDQYIYIYIRIIYM